jgi:DNA-directed RNA polymerase subunit RPC12/RpoP
MAPNKYKLKSSALTQEINYLFGSFASENLREFAQYLNLIDGQRPRSSEILKWYSWVKPRLTNENPYQEGMVLIRLLIFQFMVEGCTKQMFKLLLRTLVHQFPEYNKDKIRKLLNPNKGKVTDLRPLEENILSILGASDKFTILYKGLEELCSPHLYELRNAIAHQRFYIEPQGNDRLIFYQPERRRLTKTNAKAIKASEFFKKMDSLEIFWASFFEAYSVLSLKLIESGQLLDHPCGECGSLIIYARGEKPPTKCNFCGFRVQLKTQHPEE